MHAISLWQPWASLCVLPARDSLAYPEKRFETRGWSPPRWIIGRRVAIHAAAKWTGRLLRLAQSEPFASIFARHGIDVTARPAGRGRLLRPLPLGAVVGSVIIDRVERAEDVRGALNLDQLRLGDYSHPGRFAWQLMQPRSLDVPIPLLGQQGFWKFDSTFVLASALMANAPCPSPR